MVFAELPKEIIQVILYYAIIVRGLRRGMRLRLVCKRFAAEVIDTLYTYRALDDLFSQRCGSHHVAALPAFTQAYLEHRVHNLEDDSERCPILSFFRSMIRDLVTENEDLQYNECVRLLCGILAEGGKYEVYQLFRLTPDFRTPQSGAKYSDYESMVCALFVAAVVTNTTSIIERHIGLFKDKKWGYLLARDIETFDRLAVRYANQDTMELLLSSDNPTGIDEARRNSMFVEAAAQGNLPLVHFIHDFRWSAVSWDFKNRKKRYGTKLAFKQALETPSREVWDYIIEKRQEHKVHETVSHGTKTQGLANCVFQGGETAMIEHLLDLGTDIDGRDNSGSPPGMRGRRPILDACMYGDEDIVKLLLARGADTSSAVAVAAARGHTRIIQFLLEHGADPFGGLLRAVERGYMDIVRILLEAGVDAGETDDRPKYRGLAPTRLSSVPIACAIALEHVQMAKLLKEKGARIDGESGEECFRVARDDGLESMLMLLEEW